MKRMGKWIGMAAVMAVGLGGMAANPCRAEALISKGSSELGMDGMLDFTSAAGTEVALQIRYGYFFWDQISLGLVGGFGDNDAMTAFQLGVSGEYNYRISDEYRPIIGTDFVPFVGVGVGYQYVDIYHENENVVVFSAEGGTKFFLTDSAAITLSMVLEGATERIYADDEDADAWDCYLKLGMRFYF